VKGITLAHLPTDAKSIEITAIPQVLELFDLCVDVITIDATVVQVLRERATTQRGGDVIVCLDGKQGKLHKAFLNWWKNNRRRTSTVLHKRHRVGFRGKNLTDGMNQARISFRDSERLPSSREMGRPERFRSFCAGNHFSR